MSDAPTAPRIRFAADALYADELGFLLLISTLCRVLPDFKLQYLTSLDALLAKQPVTPGVHDALTRLRHYVDAA